MPKKKDERWLCPICGTEEMPYGKMTCPGQLECGHEPHITGRLEYCEHGIDGVWHIIGKRKGDAVSIGIAEIANKEIQ